MYLEWQPKVSKHYTLNATSTHEEHLHRALNSMNIRKLYAAQSAESCPLNITWLKAIGYSLLVFDQNLGDLQVTNQGSFAHASDTLARP